MKTLRTGSDFSGVGAFEQALKRLDVDFKTIFACDMDKYARQTYIANYGVPQYYPEDVYERKIPEEPLDIYMSSPPCQSFSLSGKRLGEKDKRGVLFYNSHEFIIKNRPRFFIFENVRGLVSDDNGKTFQRWLDYLSKSINGTPMMFPHEESAMYHVYHSVLNTKDYGIPQNRQRVFIIGIRDDSDLGFLFPKKMHLIKKLKDVLEDNVDKKYFLSEKMINIILEKDGIRDCNTSINAVNKPNPMYGRYPENKDISSCLNSVDLMGVIVKSATKKGYEIAKKGDSINFSVPSSETRRGRVGKGVAQTLDTSCNQGVVDDIIRRLTPRECFRLQDFPDDFIMPCSDTQMYKQAGNSISVCVLYSILKKLLMCINS